MAEDLLSPIEKGQTIRIYFMRGQLMRCAYTYTIVENDPVHIMVILSFSRKIAHTWMNAYSIARL